MSQQIAPPEYHFRPIGQVRSPFRSTDEVPKGLGAKHPEEGSLELLPELEAGLQDIEGFSHLFVLWVFDRSEGYQLLGRNPTDGLEHGVFATRSPRRPNPIGLSVVELLGRDGATLHVRGVDMLDGSPILDLKPYLSSIPPERLRRGWLAEAEEKGSEGDPPPARRAEAQGNLVQEKKAKKEKEKKKRKKKKKKKTS